MKNNKHIFRALNLVLIGVVFLLINFDVLEFKWRYFSIMPAVLLIYLGLNLIFGYFREYTWAFLGKLFCFFALWGLVFLQLSPMRIHRHTFTFGSVEYSQDDENSDVDFDVNINDESGPKITQRFMLPYTDSTALSQKLEIKGGLLSIRLADTTHYLISTDVSGKSNRQKMTYSLKQRKTEQGNVIVFQQDEARGRYSKQVSGFNDIKLKLNPNILWNIEANGGVGDFDLDLSQFKVSRFEFNGGASSLDVKFGNLVSDTQVKINSGVASVKIKIPKNKACEVHVKQSLSSTKLRGFNKTSEEGVYRTENYDTSDKKMAIEFDGGLSSFEVERY